jgi:glycerophosphoryl diester phosphodiesterase
VTELAPPPAKQLPEPSLEVTPAVVAHRGASGYRPEHTIEAYRLAIRMGADDIELDLVSTRDGVLVARHESELGITSDVADHPEFAERRTTRTIDGAERTGWFVEDFTLAELKRLTARERHPAMRPESASYDGTEGIPTFNEVLAMVRAESVRAGRVVGVMAELKHASYFAGLGLPLDVPLLADLRRHDLDHPRSRVTLMSFETGILRRLASQTRVQVIQLLGPRRKRPVDLAAEGDARTYADLCTPEGLAWIDGYADGVGAHRSLVLPRDRAGRLGSPSPLVRDAHRRWLTVHVWTLRRENRYLPSDLRGGESPQAPGDLAAEAQAFLDAGVDGVITDHPDVVFATRDAAAPSEPRRLPRQRVGIRIQATT